MTQKIGSDQDGENRDLQSDLLAERSNTGLHDGAGALGRSGRPKNREVENEMLAPPAREGQPPKSATDPSAD